MGKATPWAVLKCKFKDHPEPSPIAEDVYARLFTTAGTGSWNMVRYFDDVSHGAVDLSGSKVFGWLTLDANLGDYTAPSEPPPMGWVPKLDRGALIAKVFDAAKSAGLDLTPYGGRIVITFNVAIGGAFAQGPTAVGDFRYVAFNGSAAFGHEMAHAYGANHSRKDGTLADYTDPWDIMSALAVYSATDADFGTRGPGLNAANMRELGWLDPIRTWRGAASGFNGIVQLRPLHRRDLPGLLAAELPPYTSLAGRSGLLVEFRARDRWDGGFPHSAVFVHQLRGHVSYVMAGTNGNADLGVGERFESSNHAVPWAARTSVEVLAIDEATQTATLRLAHQPAERVRWEIPHHVIGGIPFDGPGIVVGPHGPLPEPWNPMHDVIGLVDRVLATEAIAGTHVRHAARREALVAIASAVSREITAIDDFGAPPEVRLVPLRASADAECEDDPRAR